LNFSPEWDELYRSGRHLSVWPWSDLVSLVMRFADRSRRLRVLELGVGLGANIPLFLSLESDYFGIEGSVKAVETLRQRFGSRVNLIVGDFCKDIPFEGAFDLVVDRGSITHNDKAGIEAALALVRECLAPGGLFVGVTWFSPDCSLFTGGEGLRTEDEFVRRDFRSGFLSDTGVVHFADKTRMLTLFELFKIEHLELRTTDIAIPLPERIAAWNIVARK